MAKLQKLVYPIKKGDVVSFYVDGTSLYLVTKVVFFEEAYHVNFVSLFEKRATWKWCFGSLIPKLYTITKQRRYKKRLSYFENLRLTDHEEELDFIHNCPF
jgi:hypothetical protein